MNKLGFIIAVTLFAIFAVADIVHDFFANDSIHYFSEQPHQLLVVGAIALGGGLVVYLFYQLSLHWQRRVKLVTLGFTAAFVTLAGCCFSFFLAGLPHQFIWIPNLLLLTATLGIIAFAGLLWFEFYQVFQKRVL